VISIGNLTVGGSGKTPLAAEIARMLLDMGERPAILTRGYARVKPTDGVVVVSDGQQIHAGVEYSGDEPLMLARMVPQAAVLVSGSRYLAGRFAESQLNSTVHILDDGFQHFELLRDIDLLIAPDTLDDVRTLPAGRFREPLDAASDADALMIEGAPGAFFERLPERFLTFEFSRRITGLPVDKPAFAFAGIARPERFYRDLENAGWQLTGRRSFRDHHHYSARDIDVIARAARESGAQLIVTTEKDAVRLGSDPRTSTGVRPQIVAVPLEVSIEPSFRPWLAERLRGVRAA
jgi:tetraacyldisaccharide 4'-kinase